MPARLAKRHLIPLVCPRCGIRSQRRRQLTTLESASQTQRPRFARLSNRSVIRLKGPDVEDFLQGLVPAKLTDRQGAAAGQPIYTAFLTAQGRISHDVFIYPPANSYSSSDGAWHIDVHADTASELVKHLRKHKLRSKFKMERLPPNEMSIHAIWSFSDDEDLQEHSHSSYVGGIDPRPGMGTRWLVSLEETSDQSAASSGPKRIAGRYAIEVGLLDYTVHRMLNGVAEGQEEIIALSALPQETNIDFFGGIDFHKGCYLGQELTIRTHHTGVVRKRILPCQIYDEANPIEPFQDGPQYISNANLKLPISGSNISRLVASTKRSTGKWLGGVGNIGLALCRLEIMTDISITDEPSIFDPSVLFKVVPPKDSPDQVEVLVKPFVPPWLRAKIGESKARRIRKKPPREGDEELDAD